MAKKKKTKKTNNKNSKKKKVSQKKSKIKKKDIGTEKINTLELKTEKDIAMDFSIKIYQKFNKIIKSVVLFGSQAKSEATSGSDIDIMVLIDDATINWDQELIAWYREELDKIIKSNPYGRELHINTTKITTWWEDLLRGDPTVINVIRYGEAMIDFGGFFEPLKVLLIQGRIKSTPEAIYSCLQRAPQHIARSKSAELATIEGLFWSMVDSAHSALMANKIIPPSPEQIPVELRRNLVNKKKLKDKYVDWFKNLMELHKKIAHGEIKDLKGGHIDEWQDKTEEFHKIMVDIVKNTMDNQ